MSLGKSFERLVVLESMKKKIFHRSAWLVILDLKEGQNSLGEDRKAKVVVGEC